MGSPGFPARESRVCPTALQIHQQPARILQRLFHTHQERHAAFAVDDAVVVAEGEVHHRADDDLAGDDDRAVLDLEHAEEAG